MRANQEWMRDIKWSANNTIAILMAIEWGEVWYRQERRRKGSWICYDRKLEKEVWNG